MNIACVDREQLIDRQRVRKNGDLWSDSSSKRQSFGKFAAVEITNFVRGRKFRLTAAPRADTLLFLHRGVPEEHPVHDVLPETAPTERHQ